MVVLLSGFTGSANKRENCTLHFSLLWLALQIRIKFRQRDRDSLFVFHSTVRTKVPRTKDKRFPCDTRWNTFPSWIVLYVSEVGMKLHEASTDRVARFKDQKMVEPFSAIKVNSIRATRRQIRILETCLRVLKILTVSRRKSQSDTPGSNETY